MKRELVVLDGKENLLNYLMNLHYSLPGYTNYKARTVNAGLIWACTSYHCEIANVDSLSGVLEFGSH